jgi:hypothetical protein
VLTPGSRQTQVWVINDEVVVVLSSWKEDDLRHRCMVLNGMYGDTRYVGGFVVYSETHIGEWECCRHLRRLG